MAKGDGTQQGVGYFPSIYQSALSQTAQDYDKLMSGYENLAGKTSVAGPSLNFSPLSYENSGDFSGLQEFGVTGGFSPSEMESMRARDIAPIRSIFDTGMRGLQRQKVLQGGYSPNFGAASARMARDMSSAIGERTTAVNANLAEMKNRNRLSALNTLAGVEQAREAGRNQTNMYNSQMPLEYAKYNSTMKANDVNNELQRLQGMQSVYGTTPGLMNTFGNQVLSAANTVNSFPPVTSSSSGGWSPVVYGATTKKNPMSSEYAGIPGY